MYNEKSRQPFPSQRVPIGRSRPVMNIPEDIPTPELDLRGNNLNCDGTRGNMRDNAARNDSTRFPDKGGCAMNTGWGLTDHPLAMVYSPLQEFHKIYEPEIALERGTIFTELDLPFEGGKGAKGGCCI